MEQGTVELCLQFRSRGQGRARDRGGALSQLRMAHGRPYGLAPTGCLHGKGTGERRKHANRCGGGERRRTNLYVTQQGSRCKRR